MSALSKEKIVEIIAKRVAQELKDGYLVNLGIGIPTAVSNYIPKDIHVTLQSENGMVGMGKEPNESNKTHRIVNAGGSPSSILAGGMFFDSGFSFSLIRGGHVDVTVLGALEVDEQGNLANWIIPGKLVPGMGGAMDLVVGSKEVIVAMEHTSKGNKKILKKCNLPLTAKAQVNLIVTEKGVMKITDKGIVLQEIFSTSSLDDIQNTTEADLIIPDDIKYINV